MDFTEHMDSAAAASYLGHSRHWLMVNQARLGIPSYRVGKRYFFLKSELDAWLLEQRTVHSNRVNQPLARSPLHIVL